MLEQALYQGIDDPELRQVCVQKLALSTYKDSHLNRESALNQAIDVLQNEFDLAKTNDQETLGLAGAIYKRKWETQGLKIYLEQSLLYYQRAYDHQCSH